MSESTTSQVRETQGGWKKLVDDHVARVEAAGAEATRWQEQTLAQNRQAIDDLARLGRDTLGYVGQLSAEWQKLTLEATRTAAGFLTGRG
jgi:hypothetical protein